MGALDFMKKMALGAFATLITAIFFALIATVAIGWDFRLSFGIFAAIFAAIPLFLIKDYFPKWTAIAAAVLLLGMALIAVWPGVEYSLFVNGERTMVAYKEWKIARDLQLAEALNPEGLQLRALVFHYKKKREDMLRQDLTNELKQVWDLRASRQMTEVQLQQRERQIIEWYGQAIATVWSTNLDSKALPPEVSALNEGALSPFRLWWNDLPWLAKIGLLVALVFVAIGLLSKFAPVRVAPTVNVVAQSQWVKAALWVLAAVALYYFVWPQVKPSVASVFQTPMPTPAVAVNNNNHLLINARDFWTDTGKVYAKGEIVAWVMPSAKVSATSNRSDPAYEVVSADGWPNSKLFDAVRPHFVSSCPTMALVGRIGEDGEWFCMKSDGRRVAEQNGKLYVSFNDAIGVKEGHLMPGFFNDNMGSGELVLQ